VKLMGRRGTKEPESAAKPAAVKSVPATLGGETVEALEQALGAARAALAKANAQREGVRRSEKAGAPAALQAGATAIAASRARLSEADAHVAVYELAVEQLTEQLEAARARDRRAEVEVVRQAVASAIAKRGEAAERLGVAVRGLLDAFAEVDGCGKDALDALATVGRFGVRGLRPQATTAEPLRGDHVAHLIRIELATQGGESWRYERTPLMGFPIGLVKLLRNDGDAFLGEVLEKLERAEALPSETPEEPHAA